MNDRRPVTADIAFFNGEAKVRFFIDGAKYAFRCDESELEMLAVEEGEVIPKITL